MAQPKPSKTHPSFGPNTQAILRAEVVLSLGVADDERAMLAALFLDNFRGSMLALALRDDSLRGFGSKSQNSGIGEHSVHAHSSRWPLTACWLMAIEIRTEMASPHAELHP